MQGLKTAFYRGRSQCRPRPYRACYALKFLRPKFLKLEQAAQELSGAFGNYDAVWARNALQACRKVRRLAYDTLLLRSARTNQIADDHQPRCDADTSLKGRVGLQPTYCSYQFQPRTHGSLGIVFVGLRAAKVDQNTVAHVLRYKATEALHGLGDTLLVATDNLA